MMVSTRGRYALRVMLDLAEHSSGEFIPMKTVAERQDISLKYLERILPILTKNGLIEGVTGKGGGYRLCRKPSEYSVWEILRLTEGSMAPVSCLECGFADCKRSADCLTLPMWENFSRITENYFSNITIADLMNHSISAVPV